MKQEQLDLIRKISGRNADTIAYRGAKLVLVDGLSQTEACKLLDAKAQAVQNGVTRYQTDHLDIQRLYSNSSEGVNGGKINN